MLRFGFKASAKHFAPRGLLHFAAVAEEVGSDSVFVSDHLQPWRHYSKEVLTHLCNSGTGSSEESR